MLTAIPNLPAGVIGFESSGKLEATDYRDTLAPALQKAADEGGIRMVLVMPAFAQSKMDAEMGALRQYCRPDVERLCPGVQPGGGRIKACLMQHKNEISVGCAKALQSAKKSH